MINIEQAKYHLQNGSCHRVYIGNIAHTIFKSKDTPDAYYWYLIQDVPVMIKDKVTTIYESKVFYCLGELLRDLNKRFK